MLRAFVVLMAGLWITFPLTAVAQSDPVASRQAQLQAQLNDIERQIAAQQSLLDVASGQRKTLQSEVNALNAEIKKAQLQIQAINLSIEQLNGGIATDNRKLASLSEKLARERESLANIMRETQMFDESSAVTVALSAQNVSGFFADLDAFAQLKVALSKSFDQIHATSVATEQEKSVLEDKRTEQQELRTEAQLAKQRVEAKEKEKNQLLTQTKGVEANYQKLIANNQKSAAQIRAELFSLAGGGGQIPLPTAIALAKKAAAATGVRPAFILGVLRQETNLGANVGQCLLTNSPNKGDGRRKTTGAFVAGVMKPTRDVDPFIQVTTSLGLDPYSMPVSCPPSYGYGGAMGPAQFIPSTWVLYKDRVARLAGHPNTPANPWDNQDAFTATALYMAYLGADKQTFSAERTAALKYFAGSNYNKPAYAFYGDSVMEFAADFQSDISQLGL